MLTFPPIQICADDQELAWISGDPLSEFPAPRVLVLPAGFAAAATIDEVPLDAPGRAQLVEVVDVDNPQGTTTAAPATTAAATTNAAPATTAPSATTAASSTTAEATTTAAPGTSAPATTEPPTTDAASTTAASGGASGGGGGGGGAGIWVGAAIAVAAAGGATVYLLRVRSTASAA